MKDEKDEGFVFFSFGRKRKKKERKETGVKGRGERDGQRWGGRGVETGILNFSSREKSAASGNAGARRLGAGLAADPFSGGVLRGPQIKLASDGTAPGHRSCRKSIFAIWAHRAPRG